MAASIDDKVVAMSFESSKFESGVSSTLSALDKLKAALHFPNSGKGLDDINAAAKRVDLSHIANSVDAIKGKFTALGIAGIAVIANLATKAVSAGANFVKAFTLDPLQAGFSEYSTNLNAVQTILANTAASGAKLKDVNAALQDLNTYSDKTIYNFSQMAKNIGTFTAAGVDLDTATASIKGIANLAALSGSNADQASTAMYQLSQAISAGRVSLQDWNSVVNAGMGGTVFQRALAQTAEAMGTLKQGTVDLVGPMKNVSINGKSFRESITAKPGEQSWLTSKVLTTTLQQFTGDLSDAQLAAQGFNKEQIKAIQQTAKLAQHAATEVKTISQVFDVAKETAGSGWAQTFQIIFGNFEEAKTTFTALSNTINGFINANAQARNKVLADWKALGGRTLLIDSIRIAFKNLIEIVTPIKEAFREIFPPTTGKDLFDLTKKFHDLAEALKPSPETVDNLRRTFAGLFSILDIGKQIVQGAFTLLKKLFDAVGGGDGGFLNLTASIGDFLVALDESLKKGDSINKFFSELGDILSKPIELLAKLAHALGDLFTGFSPGGFSGQMTKLTSSMTPFQKVVSLISSAWDKLLASFQNSGALDTALNGLIKFIQGIGPAIGHAAANMNFEAILQVIRTGLFGALVLMAKQFFGKGSFLEQVSEGFGKGIIGNISKSFDSLSGSMQAMQTNIKAKTLKEIAIAIALLTASVVALSFVDPNKLKSSITAIGFMMGELLASMAILEKISASGGFLKLPVVAAGLVVLAGAIDLLTIAVFAMSKLSWDELIRGLSGVGALLGGISAAMIPMSANSAGMIRAGVGITAIAVAMNILARAVKQMATMDWKDMARGLTGVAGGLAALAAATRVMPSGLILMGTGIVILASGLKILASAMKDFGNLKWSQISKGLVGIGGALVVIAAAMQAMPKTMALQAAGLVLVALSLGKIGDAVAKMGAMSIRQIAKGLITLAGALTVLAAGLYAMSGSLAGAAALTTASVGISLLASALTKMGNMSQGEIVRSLITLAGALTILGVAGLALAPVTPALLALGAAMVLIGGGLALAGAGIALVGVGLSAIAVAGPAAIGVLIAALNDLEQGMIDTAKNLIIGLLEIVDQLAKSAPKFVAALVQIINQLLNVVIQASPKIAEAFTALITAAVKVLNDNKDKIIKAGFDLIIALLQGLKSNITEITQLAADIIVRFLKSLSDNIGKIVDAGADLLVNFLKGLAKRISDVAKAGLDVITEFVKGVAENIGEVATAGLSILAALIKAISDHVSDVISVGSDAIVKFIEGVGKGAGDVVDAGVKTVLKFIEGLSRNALQLVNGAAQVILTFLEGLRVAIITYEPQIMIATARIGVALVQGILIGMARMAQSVYSKAEEIVGKVLSIFKKIPFIHSPSRVTTEIGEFIVMGLTKGMGNQAPDVYKMATTISQTIIDKFKEIFQISSPSKVMHDIGQAVGQGFADGLKGSGEDIRKAFTDLNNKLTDAMVNARETISSEQKKLNDERENLKQQQAKLDKERASAKPNQDTINSILNDIKDTKDSILEIQGVISENENILSRSTAAHQLLVKTFKDEKNELINTSKEYDKITEKLKDAQKALDDIKQSRTDLIKSTTEQFGQRPELDTTSDADIISAKKNLADAKAALKVQQTAQDKDNEAITKAQTDVATAQANLKQLLAGKTLDSAGNSVDQLATYEDALKHQTTAIGAYNSTLQQLRKLGLDDGTYKKLVDDGVADAAFAKQLLSGGRDAVNQLNKLDANLVRVSTKLGTNVGHQLFDSGVEAAQSLVKGLEKDQHAAGNKMREIGNEMVAELRKALGMKSPSREFIEIGQLSIMGLVQGFTESTTNLLRATDQVAKDVVGAMQKSMKNTQGFIFDELNSNPTITPILDLSVVRSQSKELAGLIPANASYGQAVIISAQQTASQDNGGDVASAGSSIKFEQNNYSPVALSEIEIFRQTKNQISQLKSVLALT